MDKVYVVNITKTLIIQASSAVDAFDKAESMVDSDSEVKIAREVTCPDSVIKEGDLLISVQSEPDNSIGLTIRDVLKGY